MPRYRYQARDAFGRLHAGQQFAADEASLRQRLADEHLLFESAELLLSDTPAAQTTPYNAAQFGLGVRAVADEFEDGDIRHGLLHLAEQLESQVPLAEALAACRPPLPADLQQVLTTAERDDHVIEALLQALLDRDIHRDISTRIIMSLAYPLGLVLIATLIFVALVAFILPQFQDMYEEFQIMLPSTTRLLFWWSDFGIWYIAAVALQVAVLVLLLPIIVGRGKSRRLLNATPVVGILFHWQSGARWARHLALLLEHGGSLPEALRLTADEPQTDANVAEFCREAAMRIENGQSLQLAMQQVPRMPALLRTFVNPHQDVQAGPLRQGAELLESMVRGKANTLHALLAPFVLFLIFCGAVFAVIGLFMPLVGLLSGLI